jgi:hypothetical protein
MILRLLIKVSLFQGYDKFLFGRIENQQGVFHVVIV